jgi:hypothetical protein
MACVASWEAVEELGDNCPLCGRACYAHELEEDRDAAHEQSKDEPKAGR